jgi:hypothetical protein
MAVRTPAINTAETVAQEFSRLQPSPRFRTFLKRRLAELLKISLLFSGVSDTGEKTLIIPERQ